MVTDDQISAVVDCYASEIILVLIIIVLRFLAPVHCYDYDLCSLSLDRIDLLDHLVLTVLLLKEL